MKTEQIMEVSIKKVLRTMTSGMGGPFGAAIFKGDDLIAITSNTVLKEKDPTCHAEMNAIRAACKELDTYDLSDCTIYCTSEPCPMCLSAIIWANIKTAYFGCTAEDAGSIGFRDDYIYKFINEGRKDNKVLKMIPSCRDECLELFKEYSALNKTIY